MLLPRYFLAKSSNTSQTRNKMTPERQSVMMCKIIAQATRPVPNESRFLSDPATIQAANSQTTPISTRPIAKAWELAAWIVAGSDRNLLSFGTGLVACAIILHIMTDWRSGVILFLVWLVFEDLARKYLGNSMTVYFTKDLIVGVAYISFLVARRRGQVATFKIPFLLPLAI